MSLETEGFQDELDLIDASARKMEFTTDKLCALIISDKFLEDPRGFEKLSIASQNALVTIAEQTQDVQNMQATPSPLSQYMPPGMPQQNLSNNPTLLNSASVNSSQGQSGIGNALANNAKHFSWTKALVAVVIIVVSAVLVVYHQPVYDQYGQQIGESQILPTNWFVFILVGCGVLVFFDQIWGVFAAGYLNSKKVEEKALSPANKLDEWITDSFNKMREKYVSAIMLIEVQTSSKANLPDFELAETHEAMYNRKQYFETTLRSEFLNVIGSITMSCNKNVWARRLELNRLISQTKAASMGAHT